MSILRKSSSLQSAGRGSRARTSQYDESKKMRSRVGVHAKNKSILFIPNTGCA